ncbi:MAG: SpoIID/LytB domain-containing protein, partial [Thermodesulfobacteriota bacterium]
MPKRLFLTIVFIIIFGVQSGYCLNFNPRPLMEKASAYLNQGRFLECVQTYNQVYEYSDQKNIRAKALVRMADVLALFVGQKKKALEFYARAIDEFPDYAGLKNAYFNSGMLYYELNKPEMAARSFKAYIRLFPEAPRKFTVRYMLDRIKEEGYKDTAGQDQKQDAAHEQESQPLVRVSLTRKFPANIIFDAKAKISASGNIFTLNRGEHSISFSRGNFWLAGKQLGPKVEIAVSKGFELAGKCYAGDVLLIKENNKPVLVNRLPIEKYLLGVVPKEMSPSWELQALEAQAIAARSYAYYIVLKNNDKAYDVASTTASQVYGGSKAGSEKSDRAVRKT